MESRQQVSLLVGAGVVCLLLSILGGVLSAGYSIIATSSILFRAGVMYLTLGVVTYLLAPITLRDAFLGALCATGLAFISGSMALYYDLVLMPSRYGTIPETSLLFWTEVKGFFVTLPISAGYLSGVLVRTDHRVSAIVVLLGAMLGGWYGGSWVALALGSAPGFTQMYFLLGVLATAGLAMLPVAVLTGWKGIDDWI